MKPSVTGVLTGARPRFVVAVGVVVWREDRMLALRRSPSTYAGGNWNVVTGGLEAGEQPLAAAVREVEEETGLAVDIGAAPVTAYLTELRGEEMVVIVFQGRYLGGEVELDDENDAYAWLTPTEFEAACSWPQLVQAVYESSRRLEP